MATTRFRPLAAQPIRLRRRWLAGAAAIAAGGLLVHWGEARLQPQLAASAQALAVRAATEALNGAVTEVVAANVDSHRIIHVERTDNGDFEVAHVDFVAVTRLQSAATRRADEALHSLADETQRLPLGQALGGSLFAGLGPALPVRMSLVGSAHSSVTADVRSAGINQTVHIVYLHLTAQVNVIAPLIRRPVVVESTTPIAYVVLAGEVPQLYPPLSGHTRTSS
ncbi:MAG: sporulation protein YunB [Alicyclobacillaceae bacterium]|nr:sporulation protein YunB [Alicyclobacillaceae bacterium]